MHCGPPEVFFFFRDCPTEIACVNTHFWCILKDWSSSCQLPIVWMMSSCTCEDRAANHPEISQQPRQYHVSCPPGMPYPTYHFQEWECLLLCSTCEKWAAMNTIQTRVSPLPWSSCLKTNSGMIDSYFGYYIKLFRCSAGGGSMPRHVTGSQQRQRGGRKVSSV